jgi:hypothetical protein
VIGGKEKNKNLSDLFVLDLRNFNWRRFFQLEGPKPRMYPILIENQEDTYLLGGVSFPENLSYEEYWRLRFGKLIQFNRKENVAWNSDVLELAGLIWEKFTVSGERVPLKMAAGTSINAQEMLVFGGYDLKGVALNVLSKINLSTVGRLI